jgi:hypothetical protein
MSTAAAAARVVATLRGLNDPDELLVDLVQASVQGSP